jgi:hypothetical protein
MAGNPSLPIGAHHAPDVDGGEPQAVRRAREDAAIEVCLSCPVMVLCDAYASSVTVDGKLAEPDGVWGGRRALERHRAFIKTRHQVAAAAPVAQVRTPQKQAVLKALAVHTDAEKVAAAAGVDLRTANWQRSRLVTQLNLEKGSATRRELLAEAVRRGLLDAGLVVSDDGTVPAVPPPAPNPPQPRVQPVPMPTVPTPGDPPVPMPTVPSREPGPVPMPSPEFARSPKRAQRRRRVTALPGQLSFDFSHNSRLEAAA